MQSSIISRWTDALKSGKYKQTTGTLHTLQRIVSVEDGEDGYGNDVTTTKVTTKDSYCCLGVLCEVAALDKGETAASVWNTSTVPTDVDGDSNLNMNLSTTDGGKSVLSPKMLDEIGLTSEVQSLLTVFNDEAGMDFKQIATVLDSLSVLNNTLLAARKDIEKANERTERCRNDYYSMAGQADANAKKLVEALQQVKDLEARIANAEPF